MDGAVHDRIEDSDGSPTDSRVPEQPGSGGLYPAWATTISRLRKAISVEGGNPPAYVLACVYFSESIQAEAG
jgi:hypothetical protein